MAALFCAEGPDPAAAGSLSVGVGPGPQPATVEVCVSGEIVSESASFLRETLLTALTSHRSTLLLNLERVTVCDASGLEVLLAARLAALSAGRRLRITAASRTVGRLLQLTDTRYLLT